jgi:hypothetical protein
MVLDIQFRFVLLHPPPNTANIKSILHSKNTSQNRDNTTCNPFNPFFLTKKNQHTA